MENEIRYHEKGGRGHVFVAIFSTYMIKMQTLHQHNTSRHIDVEVLAYFAHVWSVVNGMIVLKLGRELRRNKLMLACP